MSDETDRPSVFERVGQAAAHQAVMVAIPVLVLIQAWLAGRRLGEGASISLHGVLGTVAFVAGIGNVALAWARRSPLSVRLVAVAIVVLLFVQIGLGYSTRDNPELLSWHVPLGVGVFGLSTYALAMTRG